MAKKKKTGLAPVKLKENPSFKQVMENIRKERKNANKRRQKKGVQVLPSQNSNSKRPGRNKAE